MARTAKEKKAPAVRPGANFAVRTAFGWQAKSLVVLIFQFENGYPHRTFAHRVRLQGGQRAAVLINLRHFDGIRFLTSRDHKVPTGSILKPRGWVCVA